MKLARSAEAAIAALGVFAGSLLADASFGDGIQEDDIVQAILVAVVAAAIQWFLASLRRRH